MKKTVLIVGLVVALAVLGVGVAFAQGPAPYAGNGPMLQNGGGYLHTYMVSALAEQLGMKVEDINARLTAGETMYDIAIADGVKAEDFAALMTEIRSSALSAAVKDGVITQAQADWMNTRGSGTGNCPMQNGQGAQPNRGRGSGPGMMGGPGWQNQPTNP